MLSVGARSAYLIPVPVFAETVIELESLPPLLARRVCLVFPKSTFLIDPMVYPPLGLWYVWAECEKLGLDVAYRDLSADKLPYDYDAYFVSGTSPQVAEIRKTIAELRENAPQARILLGGSHAMTHTEAQLRHSGADVIVQCEGDLPGVIEQALRVPLKAGAPVFIKHPLTPKLAHIGRPVRKAAWRYHAYLTDWDAIQHATTTIFSSRGCPERCGFCETQGLWGRTVRWTPFETVRQEIEEIIDLGFTGIMFYDDIFPLNKKRTLQMLDVLKYHHIHNGLIWRCFLRTDILAKQGGFEYLKLMREAGLREVLAGVESASNAIKANIQKGTTIEQDTQALSWCKELGIAFKASTILGLPGETPETMLETLNWILKYRPDRADLNTYIPFPGTPITTAMAEGNNAYDIYLAKENMEGEEFPEHFFYKGPRDSSVALVGTSSLTPRQIKEFRDYAVKRLDEAGIPY